MIEILLNPSHTKWLETAGEIILFGTCGSLIIGVIVALVFSKENKN